MLIAMRVLIPSDLQLRVRCSVGIRPSSIIYGTTSISDLPSLKSAAQIAASYARCEDIQVVRHNTRPSYFLRYGFFGVYYYVAAQCFRKKVVLRRGLSELTRVLSYWAQLNRCNLTDVIIPGISPSQTYGTCSKRRLTRLFPVQEIQYILRKLLELLVTLLQIDTNTR